MVNGIRMIPVISSVRKNLGKNGTFKKKDVMNPASAMIAITPRKIVAFFANGEILKIA
tara:strand:- start:6707 stop:6880 length:174 start_codon:yes stop_codon:yes gene_type:complete